jgi:UDP-N-acetylglucosamine 1-carboxyvinyltransferase
VDKLIVHGGQTLSGRISVSGSKNSALPILAATLLTPERCVIHNVPDLSDVRFMLELLRHVGAEVTFEGTTVTVKAEKVLPEAPYELVRKMRASVCLLGPMMARCRQARMSLPGGCVIGDRPIDLHLKGMEALGATVVQEGGNVVLTAPDLVGAEIFLGGKFGSTVLGTDNVLMAATLATGTTIIESAACEPEVRDLSDFLIKMGAKITGQSTRRLEIEGVKHLHGCEHTVIPDRIEAGTFVVAALITHGDLTLENVDASHLADVLRTLKKSGAKITSEGTSLHVNANGGLKSVEIVTETYPGFPTDMQAQVCALMTIVPGISVITERIFPNRFMHLPELTRMGAKTHLEGATATITGVEKISGAPVMASDLRASAALVLAGLAAEGVTEVNRVYHIDRGYEKIDDKLRGVGARIERAKA